MSQYTNNCTSKFWVVLDSADLETVATMIDDDDSARVLTYINSKVLKYTAEVPYLVTSKRTVLTTY